MTSAHKRKRTAQLSEYEADLENHIDEASPLSKKEKEKHQTALKQAAEIYMKKDKRISIRVYGTDLERIKRIAIQEGLPYQTLITSILHKFATGQLSHDRTR